LHYAREGARVLSLGYKEMGNLTSQQLRELQRDDIESNLEFAGFLIISCPLKPDSKAVIKEIMSSSHHAIIITGDNPLTGCHVGSQLNFIKKENTLVLKSTDNKEWHWTTFNDSQTIKLNSNELINTNYDYCLTGDGFDYLYKFNLNYLKKLICRVKVFARVSPKQKEQVVTMLNGLGYYTLMCGDGTNDVGALKHAHVGVAILSNSDYEKKKQEKTKEIKSLTKQPIEQPALQQQQQQQPQLSSVQKRFQEKLKELEELEQSHMVKLGDASIASPFTYKQSSIQCVCHIIKQGRCTLVTTLQMFKILALNALILAYSQSVLYLDGIKLSDGQATMQGLLLAGCFLFISRSKPLKILSKERPLPNIFNFYTILTVLLQFAVHICSLIYLTREAHARSPARDSEFIDLSSEFKPSLLNTTVYIISLSLQVATFAINYKGRPFMESLSENKPLLWSIIFSAGAVFVLACNLSPETCEQFQIVKIPEDFRLIIISVIVSDLILSFVIDRLLAKLFGEARLKEI
jgi:manganese-transporting P-type ATPase